MSPKSASAGTLPNRETSIDPSGAATPSWPWRRTALLLTVPPTLITVAALVRAVYPLAATWSTSLLVITSVLLALIAAFAPAAVARVSAAVAVVVLVAGIAGAIVHTGVFFIPALAAMAGATVKLRRERA